MHASPHQLGRCLLATYLQYMYLSVWFTVFEIFTPPANILKGPVSNPLSLPLIVDSLLRYLCRRRRLLHTLDLLILLLLLARRSWACIELETSLSSRMHMPLRLGGATIHT